MVHFPVPCRIGAQHLRSAVHGNVYTHEPARKSGSNRDALSHWNVTLEEDLADGGRQAILARGDFVDHRGIGFFDGDLHEAYFDLGRWRGSFL